jgi:phosphatidylglycerol lysyltransferase
MLAPQYEHYAHLGEMTRQMQSLLEEHAYRYGESYDSYLVTEDRREYFWSRDRCGVVGFVRHGKYAHVVGGLLATDEDKPLLLTDFLAFARREKLRVTFYNVCPENETLFKEFGFQWTKWGEEPLVDLAETEWRGKPYEWVRRQENYGKRHDVICEEIEPSMNDPQYRDSIIDQLREVSEEHLASTTHQKELKFLVSQFDPENLARQRVFIARRNGRIEAFILCNPCLNGRMWAIETYRRRPDAVRGVVPCLMMHAMRKMKAEGVQHVSLCLIPCLRCNDKLENDSKLLRAGLSLWWRRGNWLFDMRGIYHFKSRFRPNFRGLYVAAQPKMTFSSLRSCLRLWGVCRPRPTGLITSVRQKWGKRRQREHLARPTSGQPAPTDPVIDAATQAEREKQLV